MTFLAIDLPAVLAGALAALVCALVGNVLVLRRQALLGDAISHVVLPGLVAGFWISGAASLVAMLSGALIAALLAVALIAVFRNVGRVNGDAATGVVFTAFFAAGILFLSVSGAGSTNFDIHTVLFGNLEGNLWVAAEGWGSLLDPVALVELPDSIGRLAAVLAIVLATGALAFKEIRLVAFDPIYARASGAPYRLVAGGIVVLTALAAVAAFEAVGAILVVAMFVCPAATARCLTDRFGTQIALSAAIAVTAAVAGYVLAAFVPLALGFERSVNAAGVIVVTAGLLQLVAMRFGAKRKGYGPRGAFA